jgi:hypothetical protein
LEVSGHVDVLAYEHKRNSVASFNAHFLSNFSGALRRNILSSKSPAVTSFGP